MREQDRDVLVGMGVEARAETAAEGRYDHPCVPVAKPHRLQGAHEILLRQKWDLCLGPHREVAGDVELGNAAGRAHAALLDERRRELALGDVLRRALTGRHITRRVVVLERQAIGRHGFAARIDLVHQRRAFCQRFFGAEHGRQRLVLHRDKLDRFARDIRIDGGHRRHLVAQAPHLVALEREVVAQKADAHLGRIVGRDHGAHAGQSLGSRGIDVLDARVRMPGELDLAVQHPRPDQVVDVGSPARGLVGSVGSGHLAADVATLNHGCLLPGEASRRAAPTRRSARSPCSGTGCRPAPPGSRRPLALAFP